MSQKRQTIMNDRRSSSGRNRGNMIFSKSTSISAFVSCLLALPLSVVAADEPAGSDLPANTGSVDSLRDELDASRRLIQKLNDRVAALENTRSLQPSGDSDQSDRLDEIEDMLFDIDERVGSHPLVHAFDAINLNFGGFLTQQFTTAVGEDSSKSSFNATQLELLISADVTEDISFFAALGFLREADLNLADPVNPGFMPFASRNPQIIAWANYRFSDKFELRVGRFITPHGIINIEHFPPVLLDLNQPQFLRPFPGQSIFPNFQQGVQGHGKFFMGKDQENSLQYAVYAAQHPSSSEDFNFGGRLAYNQSKSGLTVGVNYAHGHRKSGAGPLGNFSIVPVASLTSNDYDMVGADVLIDKDRILWKNEIFYTFEKGANNRFAFYTQPGYRLNDKWIVFYRYDYFDPGQGLADSMEHVLGLNYLPKPNVRFRGEYIYKQLGVNENNLNVFQLSATFSF